MSFKYRNFRKRISISYKPGFEGFLVELFIGIIFTIMAYHSYESDMVIIAVPLGLLAIGCMLAVTFSLYLFIKDLIAK